jgi:hypothetical protein
LGATALAGRMMREHALSAIGVPLTPHHLVSAHHHLTNIAQNGGREGQAARVAHAHLRRFTQQHLGFAPPPPVLGRPGSAAQPFAANPL